MSTRVTLVSLTAAFGLMATGGTATAADGDAVGRWAQPAATQAGAQAAIGRWAQPAAYRGGRSYSAQQQPRGFRWRLPRATAPLAAGRWG